MLSGAVARSAQGVSHAVSQQKGSMMQTASQQARSSQYGASWVWQQLPARGFPQVKQNCSANSTQV